MKHVKRLLAVLDPTSEDQPAAEKAVRLAGKSGAAAELFICDYDQHLSGERFFDCKGLERARENVIDGHRKRLLELAESLQATVPEAKDVEISVDARWDNPRDEAILRKLEETGADLLVKDTHYHNVLRRSLFSNTDWSLIRGCRSRLLLVKPSQWKENPVIIVAVDPTHGSDRPAALDKALLDEGAALAQATGGKLHVFHACDAATAYAVSADSIAFPVSVPVRELADSMRQHHRESMDELLQTWESDVEYTSHFVEGEMREALLTLIEEVDADIVVMGAVARSALQRVFLGSTAERVLDHLPCDLLVVKPQHDGSQG
ncbi:MAG TPA: universal stress protein [Gammaproteobacteria bacterium]|nr:universal stress protein [Gammaproteobacteria bacterium]